MDRCSNCSLPIKNKKSKNKNKNRTICQPCVDLENDTNSIYVSPVEKKDLELLLAWRSNPEVYRHFRKQDSPLSWDEHIGWFKSRDADRYDFIIHYDGRRVGVVNLGADNEVGIYLGEVSAQGKGIATKVLNWLCERFNDRRPLTAEVYKSNYPSQHLFSRCGFEEEEQNADWIRYRYNP